MTLDDFQRALFGTLTDIAPVVLVGVFFQTVVLRRRFAHGRTLLIGLGYLIAGLTLFRLGLEFSLIPLGSAMAERLARLGAQPGAGSNYAGLYAFAAAVGFAATLVEPTLIAMAERVRDLTGGAVRPFTLRVVAAAGVACGLAIGVARIVMGIPLEYVLAALLLLLLLLSLPASRAILALAYDTGPMATSVATVPLIAALGVGVAANVPGRTPFADGFGLIILALLSPVVSVLVLTHLQELFQRIFLERTKRHEVQIAARSGGRSEG